MSLFHHTPHPHEPVNVNEVHRQERASGINQRIAVIITHAFGTMQAFYVLVLWMIIWMFLASIGCWLFAKDPYPFPFLLFCSNLIQLWALPVLAVGQQVLGRKTELMAEEQFNTTMKTYYDIEEIMQHLSKQDDELLAQSKMIRSILEKIVVNKED